MSRVATNTAWLMIAQIGGLVIPLIELPVLAHALGQQGYGQVLYALGIALTASVFVEFGFNFSAARSVVKAQGNQKQLAQLVTNVLLAKLLLSLVVGIIVAILIFSGIGATTIPNHWFIWISLFILAFGFTPLWYYRITQYWLAGHHSFGFHSRPCATCVGYPGYGWNNQYIAPNLTYCAYYRFWPYEFLGSNHRFTRKLGTISL